MPNPGSPALDTLFCRALTYASLNEQDALRAFAARLLARQSRAGGLQV